MKPTALYISRDLSHKSLRSRLTSCLFFKGTSAYFEEALHHAFSVRECGADDYLGGPYTAQDAYDVIVVNSRPTAQNNERRQNTVLKEIGQQITGPSILFVGNDRAGAMPSDDVVDLYDTVVKREPYANRDRYDLSSKNKQKIIPTMLACPLFMSPRSRWLPSFTPLSVYGAANGSDQFENDVFFAGALARKNDYRTRVLERLIQAGVPFEGGLQTNSKKGIDPPEHLSFPRIPQRTFIQTVLNSKINLALDGVGEFTFRHLELWYLGAFMICSPSIREIELPLPVKENVHYVSYDSLDELVEKIHYYRVRSSERHRIAQAGKEMFDRYYDAVQHGEEIKKNWAAMYNGAS